ncbi:MAG: apolipoprotein N-acyltransferase [Pseudomonadota bacterium]
MSPATGVQNKLAIIDVGLFLLAVLGGLAHALSLAWPFQAGPRGEPSSWLQILSLALLAFLLKRSATPRRSALLGWAFATAMLAGTFWWLFISLHRYGGLPAPLAVVAVGALAAALAIYYALACGLFKRLAPVSVEGQSALFAGLWLLAELARVWLFTGFPWGEGGYAHIDGWARPLAAMVGVHGLTWLAALLASLLGFSLAGNRTSFWKAGAALGLAIALVFLPAAGKGPAAWHAPLTISLVQGNIAQDEKFQPGTGIADALRYYGEQLQSASTSLVVLPETALPLLPSQLPGDYWRALQSRFATGNQAALVGMPLTAGAGRYSNSVLGFQPGQSEPYRYDKHHLVPFGEFIPPLFRWFTDMLNIPLGDFKRGDIGQSSLMWRGERLAPNICYEDLFGEELGARFSDPATAPTIFVNVSNIAWFGNTVAIDQHLQISRMRALEFARPMVRATNTGATVVIDAQASVVASLPRHTRGVLVTSVQGNSEMTPYARWVSRLGLWPWLALCLLTVVAAVFARRRVKP